MKFMADEIFLALRECDVGICLAWPTVAKVDRG